MVPAAVLAVHDVSERLDRMSLAGLVLTASYFAIGVLWVRARDERLFTYQLIAARIAWNVLTREASRPLALLAAAAAGLALPPIARRRSAVALRRGRPRVGALVALAGQRHRPRVQLAILRANHTFRLVEVPAGDSEVTFRYRPASVRLGAAISLATLALLVLVWARTRPTKAHP